MTVAIKVDRLQKTYTRRKRQTGFWASVRSYLSTQMESLTAVRELTFTIARGESVGLIGENGAGKSTTVKMLTGILAPSAGSVETLGLNPSKHRRQLAPNIGVVFGQKPQLLWDLPPADSFKLLKAMYRIPDSVYRYTYHEAVERLELTELLRTPVRLLSLGQRMRCDLAASLLHAPAIAFLDEPTIGLDVLVKERLREYLVDMRRRFNTTMVLTTHDLKDIGATCERLIVLDRGTVLYDGSLRGFEERFTEGRIIVVDLSSSPGSDEAAAMQKDMTEIGATVTWDTASRVRVECAGAGMAPKVVGLLIQRLKVRELAMGGTDMEALVARLYRTGARCSP
jgi:viologen exporter family transport system ATP-binding protein